MPQPSAPSDQPLRLVIVGARGRMGAALVALVKANPDLVLSGATERDADGSLAPDLGVRLAASLNDALENADVVIDFTHPDVSLENAHICAERGVALVLGTTGFTAEAKREIARHAELIPIVMAPNMSVGVNVLFRIAGEVARALGADYDAEIVETHHRMKKDAPSGTALGLCEAVATARGLDPERDRVDGRSGFPGERPRNEIGVHAVRGGDVVGDHTVFFLGEGERLELTHRATNRSNFAQGALRAARWVARRPAGLYDMQDVLGLAPAVPNSERKSS